MQCFGSTILLFAIAFMVFPWGATGFCLTHPMGHDGHHGNCSHHHSHEGAVYKVPMEQCEKLLVEADRFRFPETVNITPDFNTFAVIAVVLEWIEQPVKKITFVRLPEGKNDKDPPPLGINALRGPPVS